METKKKVGIALGVGAAATAIAIAVSKAKVGTKCVGPDLYQYIDGEWVLKERNSPKCVTPPLGLATVTGAIKELDVATGRKTPIVGKYVYLDGISSSEASDSLGVFIIEDIEPGYYGAISVDGYRDTPVDLTLVADQVKNLRSVEMVLETAEFVIVLSSLRTEPSVFMAGDPIQISCNAMLQIAPVGEEVTRTITLTVNGEVIGSQEITLARDHPYWPAGTAVTFEYTPPTPGPYGVSIDGLTATFEALEPGIPEGISYEEGPITLIYDEYAEMEYALAHQFGQYECGLCREIITVPCEIEDGESYYWAHPYLERHCNDFHSDDFHACMNSWITISTPMCLDSKHLAEYRELVETRIDITGVSFSMAGYYLKTDIFVAQHNGFALKFLIYPTPLPSRVPGKGRPGQAASFMLEPRTEELENLASGGIDLTEAWYGKTPLPVGEYILVVDAKLREWTVGKLTIASEIIPPPPPPPWDPWEYDLNGDGLIDNSERVKARDDFNINHIINYRQYGAVHKLWLYQATPPHRPVRPFSPWNYDTNNDGYISEREFGSADADRYCYLITWKELQEVREIWYYHIPRT